MKHRNNQLPAKTPALHTADEFAKRYEELCKTMGFQLAFEPRWAMSKDTGDYRLIILTTVQPVPKAP